MEYRQPKSTDLKFENPGLNVYFSLEENLNLARSQISQLKEDKKKLQEALRTVITERNEKTEKLKKIRAKYKQLSLYLKQECSLIQSAKRDYEELNKNKHNKVSSNIDEINTIFELLKNYTKTCTITLAVDDSFIESLKDSVKFEKYDEFVAKFLRHSLKSVKKQQEFNEEDTPQFHKLTSDTKIDQFLENSKVLLDSLSKQQEKLKNLSNDYYTQNTKLKKHKKTMSGIPSSVKLLAQCSSSRNIRSSLGNIGLATEKNSNGKEYKTPFFNNRLVKYS